MADTIPTARLEEIRELAAKATPGEWIVLREQGMVAHPHKLKGSLPTIIVMGASFRKAGDLDHIANCDPQTISAIVSELIEYRNKDKANG